jgi:hypothetical protein
VPAGIVTVTFAAKEIGPVEEALVFDAKVILVEIVWLFTYNQEVF